MAPSVAFDLPPVGQHSLLQLLCPSCWLVPPCDDMPWSKTLENMMHSLSSSSKCHKSCNGRHPTSFAHLWLFFMFSMMQLTLGVFIGQWRWVLHLFCHAVLTGQTCLSTGQRATVRPAVVSVTSLFFCLQRKSMHWNLPLAQWHEEHKWVKSHKSTELPMDVNWRQLAPLSVVKCSTVVLKTKTRWAWMVSQVGRIQQQHIDRIALDCDWTSVDGAVLRSLVFSGNF